LQEFVVNQDHLFEVEIAPGVFQPGACIRSRSIFSFENCTRKAKSSGANCPMAILIWSRIMSATIEQKDVRQQLADQNLEALERGVMPWRKGWNDRAPGFLRDCRAMLSLGTNTLAAIV